ncbi:hypothetical protein LINPERHAP2_LOCUS9075, partial [Linum perenne]
YLSSLSDFNTSTRSLTEPDEQVPRPLPYGRQVYRSSFLLNYTTTTDVYCINMLRMSPRIFWNLCDLLKEVGGLKGSENMEVDEMVAMSLVIVGYNAKNRTCQLLFHRSTERVSRTILLAVLNLHHVLLSKPVPVPPNNENPRWKYFTDCVGAISGTVATVRIMTSSQARFRTRKGTTTINVLAACNQNLQFIYCLAGWEGSAHDSMVLRDALCLPGGLRVLAVVLWLSNII